MSAKAIRWNYGTVDFTVGNGLVTHLPPMLSHATNPVVRTKRATPGFRRDSILEFLENELAFPSSGSESSTTEKKVTRVYPVACPTQDEPLPWRFVDLS